ncbi:hypothetical protein JG687_00014923 [Phytophthora cactorum]|uniref:Uncharacterized protein n=1 Tax=Phytophthora cactorum TaxID=29920 RepID=A0A8T1TWB4_9STRA|nr:hypothetical protein JG687_00014923 [Phytophthora cactorum]
MVSLAHQSEAINREDRLAVAITSAANLWLNEVVADTNQSQPSTTTRVPIQTAAHFYSAGQPTGASVNVPNWMPTQMTPLERSIVPAITRHHTAQSQRSSDREEKSAESEIEEAGHYSPRESDNDDDYECETESGEDIKKIDMRYERTILHLQQDENDLLIKKDPVRFSTMEEARLVNALFFMNYNGSRMTVFSCTSHVERVTPAPVCPQRTGIHKPLLIEVDNLLLGQQGPKQCLTTLRLRHKDSKEFLQMFYPMAFMFARTEIAFKFTKIVFGLQELLPDCFRGTLALRFGSMDHSQPIGKAFHQV